MAMIDVPSQYVALAPLAGWPEATQIKRPLGALTGLATRFLDWRAQRETLRLLNQVDSATLRDLRRVSVVPSRWHSRRLLRCVP